VFEPPEVQRMKRMRTSYVLALLAHGALFFLGDPRQLPESEPDERIELALVSSAPPADDDGAAVAPPEPVQPQPPPPAPPQVAAVKPAPVAPDGMRPLPTPRPVAPTPVPPAPPAPPTSFRDWQRQQRRYLPSAPVVSGGGMDGTDMISRQGRDRCEPRYPQPVDVVYLLFDASGSLSETMTAQALSCAQQAAQAALRQGAVIVVGTFARDLQLSPPTTNYDDVQVALRAFTDRTATVLPARELQRYLDRAPGARSELVIVSDGWIPNTAEVLNWYRYFLELHPDNRGVMYTVGNRGHREAVDALRDIGFDVVQYDPIQGD
jgi:hypothetical protein